jgi:hypothetical protein
MMLCVRIQKSSNHPLVLGLVLPRFVLEKLHTSFAQGKSDFDSLFAKDKLRGRGQKIRNDLWLSERFVGVSDFCVHKSATSKG